MKKTVKFLLAATLLAAPAVTQAQSQMFPVPTNAFIVFGGLNWAWASPCNGGCSTAILGDSWRYATAQEWAARPAASDFLTPLGNFIGSGGQMACASPWFDPMFNHCDFGDALQGNISSGPDNTVIFDTNNETWLVQGRVMDPVPEPATVALFGVGAVALGAVARRRRNA